jgi:hypothetical protein
VRYERRVPGALIHLDVKQLGKIGRVGHRIHGDRRRRVRGIGWEDLHIAIDDATRLAYAALLADETATSTGALYIEATRADDSGCHFASPGRVASRSGLVISLSVLACCGLDAQVRVEERCLAVPFESLPASQRPRSAAPVSDSILQALVFSRGGPLPSEVTLARTKALWLQDSVATEWALANAAVNVREVPEQDAMIASALYRSYSGRLRPLWTNLEEVGDESRVYFMLAATRVLRGSRERSAVRHLACDAALMLAFQQILLETGDQAANLGRRVRWPLRERRTLREAVRLLDSEVPGLASSLCHVYACQRD